MKWETGLLLSLGAMTGLSQRDAQLLHVSVSISPVMAEEHNNVLDSSESSSITLYRHMTCYSGIEHETGIVSNGKIDKRSLCCQAMNRATVSSMGLTYEINETSCVRDLAPIPRPSDTAVGYVFNSKALPEFSYTQKTQVLVSDYDNSPLFQEHRQGRTWRHFLWSDGERKGFWKPANDTTSRLALRRGSSLSYTATLDSILSDEGGMHRDLVHGITIDTRETEPSWQLQELAIWFYVFLPADIFVNVEDAFSQVESNLENVRVNASLYTHPDVPYIDVELPSFDSSPHVVAVRVGLDCASCCVRTTRSLSIGNDNECRDTSFQIRFATKVHLRYPTPVDHHQDPYQDVHMSPPMLLGGLVRFFHDEKTHTLDLLSEKLELKASHSSNEQARNDDSLQLDTLHLAVPQQAVLSTWVAAGYANDFQLVALSTVMCSLVGASIMFWNLFKSV